MLRRPGTPGAELRIGDLVTRSEHVLKTRGTVVRIGMPRSKGTQRVWVKWNHPDTLPNPSLEQSDTLDRIEAPRIETPSTQADG